MSDTDKHASPGLESASPKKRSLSSYLSNVSSRREELEKIAQKEKKEKESETDINLEVKDIESGEEVRLNSKVDTKHEQPPVIAQQDGGEPQTLIQGKVLSESQAAESTSTSELSPSTKESVTKHEEERNNNNNLLPTIHDHESFSRTDLKSMLTGLKDKPQNSDCVRKPSSTISNEIKDDESELSEVDSDAPTEPASPPRPKRGRLVRGDKLLSSLTSRHENAPIDNSSDSELSDIEDLKPIPISSSILHGDSSPAKGSRIQLNSSPLKRSRRSSASPAKRKYVAVSKVSKPKRGVHRDAGGRTKLQIACDKGKYDLAKMLIVEEGYDVNDQDNAGNSPLHEAALNGHLDIVKLLLEHGADINIQSYEMFKDTPLIDASANGHLEVVKLLLDHGADPTIVNAKGLTAIESIDDESELDDDDERQIVREIKQTLRDAARKFKKSGSEGRARSSSIVRHSDTERSSSNIRMEDEFYWTDITSKVGREKLFKASKTGKLPYVGAFLENGGRVDFRSFLEAVKYGHEDIASLFLAFGAQVNMASKDGTTALMVAVGRGHIGTVRLLLEAGADPDARDKDGKSVLSYAKNSELGIYDEEEIKLIESSMGKNVDEKEQQESEGIKEQAKITKEDVGKEKKRVKKEDIVRREEEEEKEEEEETVRVPKKRKTESPQVEHFPQELLKRDDTEAKVRKPESSGGPTPAGTKIFSPSSSTNFPLVVNKLTSENSPSPGTIVLSQSQLGTPAASMTPKPTETPEERAQRLKEEEEYRLKRLQNKRKKEQELLQKLEMDERKRVEEKERQRAEEEKRLQQAKIMEEQIKEQQKNQAEIERRQRIRSQYPFGLKIIDFSETEDYRRYLPLYYTIIGDDKYVLDIQMCIILKDSEIAKKDYDNIEVSSSSKSQLWNILKFIFLYGGNGQGKKYQLELKDLPLTERIKFEMEEFQKFAALPSHWIKWDKIEFSNDELKKDIEKNMIEISLLDAVGSHSPFPALPNNTNTTSQKPNTQIALKPKLQYRPGISQLLKSTGKLW